MKKYKVTNRITNETREVAANSAQGKLGWIIGFVQEVQNVSRACL